LDGIINRNTLDDNLNQCVATTFLHFGHLGIVEADRELCIQLVGKFEDVDQTTLDQIYESGNGPGRGQDASYH